MDRQLLEPVKPALVQGLRLGDTPTAHLGLGVELFKLVRDERGGPRAFGEDEDADPVG